LLGDLQESPADESFISKMGDTFPLVSVSRGSSQLTGKRPSISVNNRQGTRLALDYLIGLGHQHIGFIGAGRVGDLDERYRSYREFMHQHFVQTIDHLSPLTTNSLEGGYRAMTQLFEKPLQPTAVLAADDTLAIGALRAAAVCGIRVPEDISIVGFDDIYIASYLTPALTTIRQPITAIACAAMDAMFTLLRDPLADTAQVQRLERELIIRESCAPPRR
jgi:DNA-binding LacI/PurR family transcriptional regulator